MQGIKLTTTGVYVCVWSADIITGFVCVLGRKAWLNAQLRNIHGGEKLRSASLSCLGNQLSHRAPIVMSLKLCDTETLFSGCQETSTGPRHASKKNTMGYSLKSALLSYLSNILGKGELMGERISKNEISF